MKLFGKLFFGKQGIELSVNFLVTFILAIVLFGLGILFARQLFGGAEEISRLSQEQLDEQIERPVLYFFVKSITKARSELGYHCDGSDSDQAIGIYLAYLLTGLINPESYWLNRQVYLYSQDLWQAVNREVRPRTKYQILKANGDFRLLARIFVEPEDYLPKVTIETGRQCYQTASIWSERLPGRQGCTELLLTLARQFDGYQAVVDRVSREFFNLIQPLSNGQVFHLLHDEDFRQANRHFFDCYLLWRQQPDSKHRQALEQAADSIRRYQPHFQCPI